MDASVEQCFEIDVAHWTFTAKRTIRNGGSSVMQSMTSYVSSLSCPSSAEDEFLSLGELVLSFPPQNYHHYVQARLLFHSQLHSHPQLRRHPSITTIHHLGYKLERPSQHTQDVLHSLHRRPSRAFRLRQHCPARCFLAVNSSLRRQGEQAPYVKSCRHDDR